MKILVMELLPFSFKDSTLQFTFQHVKLPLFHYHYDRFDSPEDDIFGQWSFNFTTNFHGKIGSLFIQMEGVPVEFKRKTDE